MRKVDASLFVEIRLLIVAMCASAAAVVVVIWKTSITLAELTARETSALLTPLSDAATLFLSSVSIALVMSETSPDTIAEKQYNVDGGGDAGGGGGEKSAAEAEPLRSETTTARKRRPGAMGGWWPKQK